MALVAQAELDGGGEEPERRARVEAVDVADDAVERRSLSLRPQRIRELDLTERADSAGGDLLEDVRRQHVAADDDEVTRRLVDGWLLHQVGDRHDTVGVDGPARRDHAVPARPRRGAPA